MTIGWGEIAIILVLVLLLIGPMLWRLFRFIARWRQEHHNERD
jgi:Sec-independent protein translocase protein TatA